MIAAQSHALAFGFIAATALLAGDLALPERIRRVCPWARLATAYALGVGFIAVAFTLALAAGVLSVHVVWGVQAVITLAAAARVAQLVRAPKTTGAAPIPTLHSGWSRLPWLSRACLIASAVMAVATFVTTLAPPSSMDATVYHLRMPAVYLALARWPIMPDIAQTFQPAYVEMAFGHALALESDVAGALIHWGLGIGAALSAGAWARRFGANPWPAALFVLATPLFVWESTGAFIDLGLALFGTMAIYWAATTEASRPAVILAGLLAGLAAGSKLTGAALAALAGGAGFAAVWPAWRRATGRLLAIGAIALAVVLPWYAHNLATMGNPFYPVGNPIFGIPYRQFGATHYGYGRSLLDLLSSPFDLVWRGAPFDQGWAAGPALLALVPLGAFVARRSPLARFVAAAIAVFWIFWFYSMPQTRMLLPIYPLGAALAAVAVDAALAARSRLLRATVLGIAGFSTLVGLIAALAFTRSYLPAALGREPRDAFLARMSWHYPAYIATNQNTPPGARIAVIGAKNLYYLRREATFFEQKPDVAELRKAGFSHALAVGPCDRAASGPSVIWSGKYVIPASRLGGGVAAITCATLEAL